MLTKALIYYKTTSVKNIMKFNNRILQTLLTITIQSFLLGCDYQQTLTIDTFKTFPTEIDGCSCYFSNDSTEFKKGEYIYMNDFAEISFLKINGVLTKFKQTEFKEVDKTTRIAKAKSDKYEMSIEIHDGIQSGDETWLTTGTIKLTDKTGKTISKTFYGECGC